MLGNRRLCCGQRSLQAFADRIDRQQESDGCADQHDDDLFLDAPARIGYESKARFAFFRRLLSVAQDTFVACARSWQSGSGISPFDGC